MKKADMQKKLDAAAQTCRDLMVQLSRPRTPGEWYAVLEMFELLRKLVVDLPSDHLRMKEIRKFYREQESP